MRRMLVADVNKNENKKNVNLNPEHVEVCRLKRKYLDSRAEKNKFSSHRNGQILHIYLYVLLQPSYLLNSVLLC